MYVLCHVLYMQCCYTRLLFGPFRIECDSECIHSKDGLMHYISTQNSPAILQHAAIRRNFTFFLCILLAISLGLFLLPADFKAAYAKDENDVVVALDIGHGKDPTSEYSDPGACANGIQEADANYDIAMACADELHSYNGVKVVILGRYEKREDRINEAVDTYHADVVVSIHCNSAESPSANGCEVLAPNDSAYLYNETHVVGTELGRCILSQLSSLGFKNRGLVYRDCTNEETYPEPGGACDWYGINYWARWRGIPGIIVEHGFLSNADDAAKLGDSSWRASIGRADAAGIAQYYGLSKAAIDTEHSGVSDSDLEKTGEEVFTPMNATYEDDPCIMGTSQTSVDDMVSYFDSKKKTYPSDIYSQYGASTIREFCQILLEEADAEGVRAEVVFCQSMKETGYLQFGGRVQPEQCNFAGLGATDGGGSGADFSSYGKDAVRIGLRAQVQHLKGYACKDACEDSLAHELVDPRFNLISEHGCAPTVKGLSGRWATDPDYGNSLTIMINSLLNNDPNSAPAASVTTGVKFSLADIPDSVISDSATMVYVDGVPQKLISHEGYAEVDIKGGGTHSVVLYEYKENAPLGSHESYPISMYVWIAVGENGHYSVKRLYGFDDLMTYAGSSIRITGNKGIRMITGMSQNVKHALIDGNLLGYTLIETGTLLGWGDKAPDGNLTMDTSGVSRGKAFEQGKKNPVFSSEHGMEYYTNVLVGFNSKEQYKRDLAMRPYIILQSPSGEEFTIYGGTVYRNIGYIAEQNADTFAPNTPAYDFVHGIIDACKG